MSLTDDEKKFLMGVQFIGKRYGYEVDINLETKTLEFKGPNDPDKISQLTAAISDYAQEMGLSAF